MNTPNTLPANGGVSDAPLKRRLSEKNHLAYIADPLSSTACRGVFVNDVAAWWWDAGLVYERQSAAAAKGLWLRAQSRQPSAQGGEPVAYVVRDVDTGLLLDFADYYDADQFLIKYNRRMPKPQFLFCYEAPLATPPNAPQDSLVGDAERWKWLDEHGTLVLKRIANYGQKWAEVRFPWVGDPFANRHGTLTEAVDFAIRAGKKG